MPLPLPVLLPLIVSQEALPEADQAQPDGAFTAKVPVAASLPMCPVVGDSSNVHGVAGRPCWLTACVRPAMLTAPLLLASAELTATV